MEHIHIYGALPITPAARAVVVAALVAFPAPPCRQLRLVHNLPIIQPRVYGPLTVMTAAAAPTDLIKPVVAVDQAGRGIPPMVLPLRKVLVMEELLNLLLDGQVLGWVYLLYLVFFGQQEVEGGVIRGLGLAPQVITNRTQKKEME